jgi:hypothetical protein
MTTEWVDSDNGSLEYPPRSKAKWTGLVMDPLTSIYEKVIQDIETEYDSYAAAFASWTDHGPTRDLKGPVVKGGPTVKGGPVVKGGPTVKEGFEYEIDNTPIYASPDVEKEKQAEQEQEQASEEPVTEEPAPPKMTDTEKSNLWASVADIIIRIITVLATLFVSYNLYYNMKKTGKQIDFYSGLNFISFGPIYVLTNAMLKTVKFFDDAMTDAIPGYLQKLIDYTTTFSDRTMFIMLFMIASIIVNYLKGELTRIYNFLFANPLTGKSLYKFLFKSEGNASVSGLHKAVFIYYYLVNNFSIWDSEAGITYNIGMIFFKSIGFIFWLIFVIVCFAAIFKPMLSFTTLIHFGIVFFYSMFCIPYDTKDWTIKNTINIMRSMSFDMNINGVLFDPYTDNEYKQMFESGYKGLFKMVPYGIMIYAFAVVIPDILKINVDAAKWAMLALSIISILGISISGLREYFIVNKIIKDVKNAIDDKIEDFKNIDWDGMTTDQARLIQHLKADSEKVRLNVNPNSMM